LYERLTEEARAVPVRAEDIARGLDHDFIGPEHQFLALYDKEARSKISTRVLEALELYMGITEKNMRAEVLRINPRGAERTEGQILFTRRGKWVLELALHEALSHAHNHVGPEHILCALFREGEGDLVQGFQALGGDVEGAYEIANRALELEEDLWPGHEPLPQPDETSVEPVVIELGTEAPTKLRVPAGHSHFMEGMPQPDGSLVLTFWAINNR
jgi:ATP-dependent Clp protease ATP-binding subunit ClpA